MKKLLSLLAACALCGSMLAALPVSAEETTRKTGDIDGDGVVDSNDSVWAMKYYAKYILHEEDVLGLANPNLDFSLAVADVNKDGLIDTDDAYYMAKYFARSILGEAPDTIEEMMASYKK